MSEEEKIYLNWSDPTVYWSGGDIDYVWKDVYIVRQVAAAIGGAGGIILDEEPWGWLEKKVDKKVADQFKRIVIKVNGLEKVKDPTKEPKVTVEHIRSTFKHFGVDVQLNTKSVEIEVPAQNIDPVNVPQKSVMLSVQPRVISNSSEE